MPGETAITELVDVLDQDGSFAGRTKPKYEVHRDGDWHRSVHVWIANANGALLLQRRSPLKENHPGLWDVSAAGHVAAGELPIDCAIREVGEELGVLLRPSELEFVATLREQWILRNGSYVDNEWQDVYFVRRSIEPMTLHLDPEEVDDVALVSQVDFARRVTVRDPSLVGHWKEYELLLGR